MGRGGEGGGGITFFFLFIWQRSGWNYASLFLWMQYYEGTMEQTRFVFQWLFSSSTAFPQTPLFGLSNTYSNKLILKHYIIWLFKLSLYNSRKQEQFTLRTLIKTIAKVKDIEKKSLETMIKILCCATINGKILKICRLWSGDIILLLFLCCFC